MPTRMEYALLCAVVFLAAYILNTFYVTVFYHRGLTHGAVKLRPWARRLVVWTGNWVTGIDPKGWSCMHRLHHLHSDTPLDPHSPVHQGIFPIILGQLHSYNRTLVGLLRDEKEFTQVVPDLDFPVSWLNRIKLWFVPYVVHAVIAVWIAVYFHAWILAACYWLGMMSHPIQGWMVNALGHRFGYRNFATDDNSRNNLFVAWFVCGEGFQNNHHQAPAAPKFSVKWWEVDLGYVMCLVAKRLGVVEIPHR